MSGTETMMLVALEDENEEWTIDDGCAWLEKLELRKVGQFDL